MVYVIMHRFVLPKIKIVSYKDLISKEKNPNIRLDTKFFVENGDFKQRGYKGFKGKVGGVGNQIGTNRADISTNAIRNDAIKIL